MLRIAHIIHPVIVEETSDLIAAQPITFETMRIASKFAKGAARITLYAVQYHDEKHIRLPRCFKRLPGLKRSILDVKIFKEKRKLALIKDILDALYRAAHADYLIYTNVDIALQPYFYQAVIRIIEQGYDAFVINRKSIPDKYSSIHEIPLMYAEPGEYHKGYDCFIFKRDIYPKFKLGDVCIGTAWVGRALLVNLASYTTKFKEYRDSHMTFHIGNPRPWLRDEFSDYLFHNRKEVFGIFDQIESEQGRFESIWRSYLIDSGEKRQFPSFR